MMNNLNVNTDEFVSMKISLVEVWHYKRCYRKVKKLYLPKPTNLNIDIVVAPGRA